MLYHPAGRVPSGDEHACFEVGRGTRLRQVGTGDEQDPLVRDSELGVHPGRGFYFVCRDAKTGKLHYQHAHAGYEGRPVATLLPKVFGRYLVVTVQDRQTFQLKVFDSADGKLVHTLTKKGVGPFGLHGRVSATVQNGRPILLSKNKLSL